VIDLDDLLITKKMKRQRHAAMKETKSEREFFEEMNSQSAQICSQVTLCGHEKSPLLVGNPEAFYLSGASPIEKPVL